MKEVEKSFSKLKYKISKHVFKIREYKLYFCNVFNTVSIINSKY